MEQARETKAVADPERSSRSPMSVALLAGIACMPIVVAVGFLTDRDVPSLPHDISVAALRGAFDHGAAERPSAMRAGF